MRKEIEKIEMENGKGAYVGDYQYEYEDLLGAGNQSKVYRGHHSKQKFQVAVKIIQCKEIEDNLSKGLLQNSLNALETLRTAKNILRLYDIMYTDSEIFVITQLCKQDLMSLLQQQITEEQAWFYLGQILQGFSQLYDKGLVHRDLKPDNIFLGQDGKIKIGDLGFCADKQSVRRQVFFNIGSPVYMAPQTLLRNEYSHESDIWAIGITFFQILTGQMFWTSDLDEDIKRQMNEKYITIKLTKTEKVSERARNFFSEVLVLNKKYRIKPYRFINYIKHEGKEKVKPKINESDKLETLAAEKEKNYIGGPKRSATGDFAARLRQNAATIKEDFKEFTEKQEQEKKSKKILNVLDDLFTPTPVRRTKREVKEPEKKNEEQRKEVIPQEIKRGYSKKLTLESYLDAPEQFPQILRKSRFYLGTSRQIYHLLYLINQEMKQTASALTAQSSTEIKELKRHIILTFVQICSDIRKGKNSLLLGGVVGGEDSFYQHQQFDMLMEECEEIIYASKNNPQIGKIWEQKIKLTGSLQISSSIKSLNNFVAKTSMFLRLKQIKQGIILIISAAINLLNKLVSIQEGNIDQEIDQKKQLQLIQREQIQKEIQNVSVRLESLNIA